LHADRLRLRLLASGRSTRSDEGLSRGRQVVSESEGRAWLDAFHEQGAQGPIVAGRLHIFVWGRKPE
jgi:hypothetical protein